MADFEFLNDLSRRLPGRGDTALNNKTLNRLLAISGNTDPNLVRPDGYSVHPIKTVRHLIRASYQRLAAA